MLVKYFTHNFITLLNLISNLILKSFKHIDMYPIILTQGFLVTQYN